MKIQTKLSLIYSCIFGVILLIFIVAVYFFYSNKSQDDYFERLHIRAALKVDLIDGETISADILHLIYESTPGEYEPMVTIYTKQGKLIYCDKQEVAESNKHLQLIGKVKQKGFCKAWDEDNKQTYGFLIEGLKGEYVVFATGYDVHGFTRLSNLRWMLLTAYLIAMIFIVLTVRLFARQAFRPVSRMIDEVKKNNPSNLNMRLNEGNRKDELASLAITFNNMLAQLEEAFSEQKRLVYNISHELRTPLAAIITELELSEQRNCDEEEYQRVIGQTLKDARRLAKLSNSLLDLAKASYNVSGIAMHPVRLDELMLEVCSKVQRADSQYSVHLLFDKEPDDESYITVDGNSYLLEVAFSNLVDNGCKYSADKTCEMHLSFDKGHCLVSVVNNGTDIPKEEQQAIFTPFFRGSNKHVADGNGIGLYLTQKIIDLHQGNIELQSNQNTTIFTVELPTTH
ncbi:HAMP domain-containing sensor histidine kinase [uncultured Bacteroides sp.]|uniref:HAMP domain-containing sensor histidine kinase n=1 Tax=uncultured Bacteroides sp. TaxID=162156 RepID=UPI002AA8210A|nr:HAMP domain-containing sensor histidine kinase [uncultured Bacteroides sp.]